MDKDRTLHKEKLKSLTEMLRGHLLPSGVVDRIETQSSLRQERPTTVPV